MVLVQLSVVEQRLEAVRGGSCRCHGHGGGRHGRGSRDACPCATGMGSHSPID